MLPISNIFITWLEYTENETILKALNCWLFCGNIPFAVYLMHLSQKRVYPRTLFLYIWLLWDLINFNVCWRLFLTFEFFVMLIFHSIFSMQLIHLGNFIRWQSFHARKRRLYWISLEIFFIWKKLPKKSLFMIKGNGM